MSPTSNGWKLRHLGAKAVRLFDRWREVTETLLALCTDRMNVDALDIASDQVV
jgi:hypothetical protein